MTEPFVIRSTCGATLQFSEASRRNDAWWDCQVELSGPVNAQCKVPDLAPSWPKYFERLAKSWRGWSGAVEAETIEGHLSLSASSDPLGHVELKVVLLPGYEAWSALGTLQLEAGQLDGLAKEAKRFFSP